MKCIELTRVVKSYKDSNLDLCSFIESMQIFDIESNENKCIAVWLAMSFNEEDNSFFLCMTTGENKSYLEV